jgi:hypothetical protein
MDLTSILTQRLFQAGPLFVIATCTYLFLSLLRTIRQTYNIRKRYNDIPQLPRHPAWGNLINCGEKLAGSRHPDYGFEEIWESMGRPVSLLELYIHKRYSRLRCLFGVFLITKGVY